MHALAAFGNDPPSDAAALRAWLCARISAMLTGERARLMAVLYRIDVRERDVRAALASGDPPSALADAVIARAAESQARRRGAAGCETT